MGRIALADSRVLSVCTVTGGRRITVVVVKRLRASNRLLMNQCRQEVFLMNIFPSNGFRGFLHKGEVLEKGLL